MNISIKSGQNGFLNQRTFVMNNHSEWWLSGQIQKMALFRPPFVVQLQEPIMSLPNEMTCFHLFFSFLDSSLLSFPRIVLVRFIHLSNTGTFSLCNHIRFIQQALSIMCFEQHLKETPSTNICFQIFVNLGSERSYSIPG